MRLKEQYSLNSRTFLVILFHFLLEKQVSYLVAIGMCGRTGDLRFLWFHDLCVTNALVVFLPVW